MTGGSEVTPSGDIVATGDGVTVYDIIAMRTALRLEIRTGMVMRSGFSIVRQAIRRGYVTEGTRLRRDAYAQLDALAVSLGADPRPL